MARRAAPWRARWRALKRYVDSREYPGISKGKPTKYAKDKLRKHHQSIARFLEQNPDAYAYRPRKRETLRQAQRLLHPESRAVLPRIRSLQVAWIPDVGPGRVSHVRVGADRVRYTRSVEGRRSQHVLSVLTRGQRWGLALDPAAAVERFTRRMRPRDRARIRVTSGGYVGSAYSSPWAIEYDAASLVDAIVQLSSEYGASTVEAFIAGFELIHEG